MDGVYYNQEVTEEVLNAMATDLGATSFNGFDGVTKFGANELNKITQELVEKGILISGDMCRCVKTDTGIIIQTGTIVFANGAKKTISSPVEITVDNGNVVYALNNQTAGTCTIEVANSLPDDTLTDYVSLCEITSDGKINDKRIVAQAKVNLNAGSNIYEKEFSKEATLSGYNTILKIEVKEWEKHKYFILHKYSGAFILLREELEFDKEYGSSVWRREIKLSKDDEYIYVKVDANEEGEYFQGNLILI